MLSKAAKTLIVVLVSLFVLTPATLSFAQSTNTVLDSPALNSHDRSQKRLEAISDRKQKLTDRQAQRRADRCQLVTAKVNAKIDHYQAVKERHVHHYRRIISRVTSLVEKLTEKNCQTATITADLEKLETMVAKLKQEFEKFKELIHSIPTKVCDSQQDHRSSIEAAHAQLKILRAQAQEIKTYIKHTLKEDIKTSAQACRQLQSADNTK